ncbi:hypothetical protein AURDEDRAFT_174156 [Auricularia subglabra TFB-10046 SS5]|nr:hypothetical protein AURDEDRAFT_174156 [Auricularia subglabra TFB-10046 SS5]
MASLRHLRTERVHADEAALQQIQAHLERVQREHDDTRARADELAREARELQDMMQQTAARLAEGRAVLVRDCILALPEDVLRCLFEAAIDDDPFAVAAVCARWRRVALAFPAMWSKIHVPLPPVAVGDIESGRCERFAAAQLRRVNTMLERSRSAALDVYIPWSGWQCQGIIQTYSRQLLSAAFSQIARWRVASIGIPRQFGRPTLDFVRGPTPLLVDLNLRVSLRDGAFDPPQIGYLPYAPRLRKLAISGLGMGCATSSNFPNLSELSLLQKSCTNEHVSLYLRNSADTLVNLSLGLSLTHPPTAKLVLPRLQALHITHAAFPIASPQFVLPSLRTLSLVPFRNPTHPDPVVDLALSDTLVPFLEAVSPTVRFLNLGYPINDDCLSIVARLQNIEQLQSWPSAIDLADPALARLVSNHPPIWPRLARIIGLRCPPGDGSYDGILRLIAARTSAQRSEAVEQDVARPVKLLQVEFEKGAPEWLVAEVDRLLTL